MFVLSVYQCFTIFIFYDKYEFLSNKRSLLLSCILVSSSLFTKFSYFHISYFLVLLQMETFKFIFSLLFYVSLLWSFSYGCVLYYFDIVYDLVLIVQYFNEGRWLYYAITLGIMLLPNVILIFEYMKSKRTLYNFCMHLLQLRVLEK